MRKYVLEEKIGEGGYGKVYRAEREGKFYALKTGKTPGSLSSEIKALKTFSHPQIPKILECGVFRNKEFIVMPLFRISLLQLFTILPSYFNIRSVSAIGQSLLDILRYIHTCGYIYCDLKPENIMLGFDNQIHLIDFGMCKRYVVDNVHNSEGKSAAFVGTTHYASVWTHLGLTQSRRDDLESLGYVLLFLYKGLLPWASDSVKWNEKQVGEIKQKISLRKLCKDCVGRRHWIAFFRHIRGLKFADSPDYSLLKVLLKRIGTSSESSINACIPECLQFGCS